ncbi:hypothetical protein HF086_001791 [Spodoptera exigua]|uniref:Insulin-like domain-containing protein n=1 Tax=Spodoptera exigua TaxID=7107 RepID=A0A922MEE9_SPOEX|nr:hypothetical protein HF086_001791 [Spodoptera exigua]
MLISNYVLKPTSNGLMQASCFRPVDADTIIRPKYLNDAPSVPGTVLLQLSWRFDEIKMKIFCILVLCTIALSSAEEHPRGRMIQVCGAELARAVKRVCEDGDLDFFNLQHIQHPKPEAGKDDTRGQRRNKRSLVEECCYNVCTIDEFLSYC